MADRSQMPSSFDEDQEYQETGWQKVSRKLREEPLIPLGTALTCLALYNAWRAMRRGDHAQVQRMFRARIGAQAFTVVAIVAGGAYYGADREKRAELIKLEAQQRAEERHQRWLHELEIRDREEKDLQEAMRRRRERAELRRAADHAADGAVKADTGHQTTGPEAAAEAKGAKEGGSSGGGGVLGALSSTGGGWFGSGAKKSEDETATKNEETAAKKGDDGKTAAKSGNKPATKKSEDKSTAKPAAQEATKEAETAKK